MDHIPQPTHMKLHPSLIHRESTQHRSCH